MEYHTQVKWNPTLIDINLGAEIKNKVLNTKIIFSKKKKNQYWVG